MTYKQVLDEFEEYPSDKMYEWDESYNSIELSDPSYRTYNLMGTELRWLLEKSFYTKGWSRKKKRKINNRLIRYYRNLHKRLKHEDRRSN